MLVYWSSNPILLNCSVFFSNLVILMMLMIKHVCFQALPTKPQLVLEQITEVKRLHSIAQLLHTLFLQYPVHLSTKYCYKGDVLYSILTVEIIVPSRDYVPNVCLLYYTVRRTYLKAKKVNYIQLPPWSCQPWNIMALLRHQKLVLTQRRARMLQAARVVPYPRVMVWTPEIPPEAHDHQLVSYRQQFDICFPSYYQVPIDVTAG